MREGKTFGKRQESTSLPTKEKLRDTFGVTNDGYDSRQIVNFVQRTTGVDIAKDSEEELAE